MRLVVPEPLVFVGYTRLKHYKTRKYVFLKFLFFPAKIGIQVYCFKDYRDHDFPNTEFSYFLTIDTRQ